MNRPFNIPVRAILLWGACLVALAAFFVVNTGPLRHPERHDPDIISTSPLGGPFDMMDEKGQPVTQETYAGKIKIIFFGFTFCPSVCPTELLKITDILNALLKEDARKIQPLFVSVDRQRDTPDVLKVYTDHFDQRIVGLTGTQEQIDKMIAQFRVYAAIVPTDGNEYTVDHSAFLYVTDQDNRVIKIYDSGKKVTDIVSDLQAILLDFKPNRDK